MGCLKPIQIMYVPTVNTPLTKCPDLPYVNTDINEAKCELNIAIYYFGIMSVNINWKELCSGIRNICCVKYHSSTQPAFSARTLQPASIQRPRLGLWLGCHCISCQCHFSSHWNGGHLGCYRQHMHTCFLMEMIPVSRRKAMGIWGHKWPIQSHQSRHSTDADLNTNF